MLLKYYLHKRALFALISLAMHVWNVYVYGLRTYGP